MPTDTPPRRKWNITRWLFVLAVLALAGGGWRVYAFRSALAEAKALGWHVEYTDPVETIRANWKSAFEKETWLDCVTIVEIPTSEEFEQHLAIVHRLNPKTLRIDDAHTLRDLSGLKPLSRLHVVSLGLATALTNVDALKNLSALHTVWLTDCTGLTNVDALKNLSALQWVVLIGCTGLTNVDALKNLSALQRVRLEGCTGLTNVDALKNLSALEHVDLTGCTGLTKESVAALRAALPNTQIWDL
jgi:Leucine-rich repeat (LRR) protein